MNLDYWLEQMKATTAIAAHLAVPVASEQGYSLGTTTAEQPTAPQ
jgi:hypothetical protein